MRNSPHLNNAKDIVEQFNFIRRKKQEYFVCLSMTHGNRIIRRRIITIGLLDMVPTHPRELFAGAVTDRAAYIIVAHNHPSGDVAPSRGDVVATQQLVAAGILLGIPLRDHYIVTADRHFSFASEGHL